MKYCAHPHQLTLTFTNLPSDSKLLSSINSSLSSRNTPNMRKAQSSQRSSSTAAQTSRESIPVAKQTSTSNTPLPWRTTSTCATTLSAVPITISFPTWSMYPSLPRLTAPFLYLYTKVPTHADMKAPTAASQTPNSPTLSHGSS